MYGFKDSMYVISIDCDTQTDLRILVRGMTSTSCVASRCTYGTKSNHTFIFREKQINVQTFDFQEMMRRIVAQPMAGRPLPSSNDTADTERLGYELKVRLASRSPVLRCHESVSSGRLHFYETSPSRREVPIYDIDEEGDAHLLCSVSVRATKS